ncbi:MAG: SEL1-like repeat protein [Alphaproteobacteria bacterium]|nr:SEL1-like repeat protein [Alphaproteobacteria bacterium]
MARHAAVKKPSPLRDAGGRDGQIINLLDQIGARLIASEHERKKVRETLDEYRELFADMEDRAMLGEKAFITLQNKISKRESVETALERRQAALEKSLADKMDKIEKAALLVDRIEDALTRQNRRLEKMVQDRTALVEKLDRIEEAVTETQDTLHNRAMVMLTGKTAANEGLGAQLPVKSRDGDPNRDDSAAQGWARLSLPLQTAGMAGIILLAGLAGWGVNAWQQQGPSSVQESTALTSSESVALQDTNRVGQEILPASVFPARPPAQDVIAMDDEERLAAFEDNPDALATQLNALAPGASDAAVEVVEDVPATAEETNPSLQRPPVVAQAADDEAVEPQSPVLDLQTEAFLKAQADSRPLADRIPRDTALPGAVREIQDRAYAADPEAQHDLAAIYTAGHGGVPISYEKAAQWFREAALGGIANARYNLGVLYHQGLGVAQDTNKALGWYRAAAALGHPEAQYNLGIAAIEGIGTDYDPVAAAAFFAQAVEGGIMEAAYNLGLIYENGLLGAPDPATALTWYQKAADQGSREAARAFEQLSKSVGAPVELKPAAAAAPTNESSALSPEAMDAYGIPRKLADADGSEEAPSSPSGQTADSAVVAQIQEQLVRLGLYPGPADGRFGVRTEDAIRSYQTAYGLSPDGRPGKALLLHMLTTDRDDAPFGDVGSRAE